MLQHPVWPWLVASIVASTARAQQACNGSLQLGTDRVFGANVHQMLACRWDEMTFSIFVMFSQVGLEAYILGTLFHYVVKKDAKLEEFR